MAASMVRSLRTRGFINANIPPMISVVSKTWVRTAFFWQRKDKEEELETEVELPEKISLQSRAKHLRKREGISTVRCYVPPPDAEARVLQIASETFRQVEDLTNHTFPDRTAKFHFLDRLMREFDHPIKNWQLRELCSVADAVRFFSTPVADPADMYHNLAKADLPPNLHVQKEALRFDPETDTMFGGVTAFPESETIISSLKFKRKYGGKK